MAEARPATRRPGVTYAVSNTGPLISAFQSDSFALLTHIFAEVHISTACMAELTKHGWEEEVRAASPKLVIVKLAPGEERHALAIAKQIAQHPDTNDPIAEHHLGEAQAIVLALRSEYRDDLLLLDELAARAIAKHLGVKLSGFPGALLLAVQGGLITAEELKVRLEQCRAQGTHYGVPFIKQVYEMAKQGRRKT
jgi:predicted nucleic acid-binding protein